MRLTAETIGEAIDVSSKVNTKMSENGKRVDEILATWRGSVRRVVLVVASALAIFAVAVLVPEHYTRKSKVLRRAGCVSNLHQIGQALNTYCAVHGKLPPPCTTAPDGRALLSWRVLILPYLGDTEKSLFEAFDLNEPWDGPNNSRLLRNMPNVFRCPSETRDDMWSTSYVMLIEPEPGRNGNDVGATGQNRPFVVEISGLGIAWSEPRDLNATELPRLIAVPPDPAFPRNHDHILNVLSRDGFVTGREVTEEFPFH